jgi:methyltransferase (TIGR00027 family)
MRSNRASKTMEITAAIRAGHLAFDDPPKIFEDPLAGDLIMTPFYRAIAKSRMVYWICNNLVFRYNRPTAVGILIRARFAEDQLRKAVEKGVRQYVLLGAGLDSFAWRHLAWSEGVRVFEVDHPPTQEAKRRRFDQLGFVTPDYLEFSPVDFERETVTDCLARSSFARDRTAFFNWMGTVPYLTREAVFNTLNGLAGFACPGSEIVFDYPILIELFDPQTRKAFEKGQRYVTKRGEPWLFFADPRQLPGEIEQCGYQVIENMSPNEMEARYLAGRKDGLHTTSACYLVHCRLLSEA